jgi:hypothetical protein
MTDLRTSWQRMWSGIGASAGGDPLSPDEQPVVDIDLSILGARARANLRRAVGENAG